ncbi:sulfatase-like hydrolase/transferase [Streptomyces albicerus]|uniref:sulfatase-like hydrolase/transferase n=1 Tax=Streptomyces albicerus TaxID=2569859 RepID=UPI001788CF1C|nr:sulfatase-like hydrolase/transferase [Streptomyces albicerus]
MTSDSPAYAPADSDRVTRRPNVLVFFTDQQRWDTTGLHGNPLGLTPVLDGLAEDGVIVDRSFTCQPVCAPSRASLQTGQYPTTTGVFRNGLSLPREAPTMARTFRDAGNATGYIGKWHLAGDHTAGPVPEKDRAGYEYWLAANLLEFTSDAYETTLYDNDGAPHRFGGYRADALGAAAIDFIGRDRGEELDQERPFFLFLSFLEPHHQNSRDDYPAPTGYSERYADPWVPSDLSALGGGNWAEHLPGYYGMVRRLDEVLGRIVNVLGERGELDNTIILFTSDHGCHFKTRNDEYKRSVHDASLRVPTVLRGAGLRGGVRVPEPVSHVDLPPTLLDAAGIEVPDFMQGRSLLPLLRGEDAHWPQDVLVQISESEVGRALRTDRWKYGVTAPGADAWNDARAETYEDAYLYDLESDPDELTNLVDDPAHASLRQELRERLTQRIVASGEPQPTITAKKPAAAEQS